MSPNQLVNIMLLTKMIHI